MKHYLLPEKGKFYKANLHMHTTVSDGKETPEETKVAYMKAGYSVVAFSDHEVLLSHEDLTDENFVAITSFEKTINCPPPIDRHSFMKTAHMNFFALDPKNISCPVLNPSTAWGNAKQYITDEMKKLSYKATYSTDGLNDVIKKANDAGYLVTLNHPVWSMENHDDYSGLKGLWGIEVYNTGCVREGYPDTVQPFEDLLREGNRIFPVATDDAHSVKDHFGGFVMIKSEKLDYASIMTALKNGDFYASTGPEIRELYIEDGKLVVECSAARSVTISTERRGNLKNYAAGEEHMTRTEFDLSKFLTDPDNGKRGMPSYFRVTVTGFDGSQAYTRAFFMDEFDKLAE